MRVVLDGENPRDYARLHPERTGPEAARDAFRREHAPTLDLGEMWMRCEAVIESLRALRQATSDLAAETQRIVAQHRKLKAEDASFLQHYVQGLARMLRECGAPPERALVLVKREMQPLMVASAPESIPMLTEQVVRWFVDGYYAA